MRILLDSGAYGVWTRDVPIELDEYTAFIKRHEHLLHHYVNLDVIPGLNRVRFWSDEALGTSARKGYENQQRMKDAGLAPIPTFHEGESLDWLERYLADGEPYIGIASYGKRSLDWLDKVFPILTTKDGLPLVKTHGFGMTSTRLILRYPWHSCDSTRWAINRGTFLVPRRGPDGMADYSQEPVTVHCGDGDHHRPLGSLKEARPWIDEWLDQAGLSVPLVANDVCSRRRAFIYYFRQLERWVNSKRPDSWFPLYIVFATLPGPNELNDMGIDCRLLSYLDLRGRPGLLERYMETGGVTGKPPRIPKPDWSKKYRRYRSLALLKRLGLL